MVEPRSIGNKSDEIAEHEAGADFSQVNSSQAPPPIQSIPVQGEFVDDDVLLRMRREGISSPRRGVELKEGAREILAAQLFEDESLSPPTRGAIQRKESQRGMLVWWAIRDNTAMAMWGDRVLIKRDTMASAYSCQHCEGRGHTDVVCPTCKGTKVEKFSTGEQSCRSCAGVLGYGKEEKSNSGFVGCDYCSRSGWAGGVVIPEIAEQAPVSGIVVSIGPDCVNLKLGDRVLHSKYAGHNLGTPEKETYTVMREHETLSLLRDLKA